MQSNAIEWQPSCNVMNGAVGQFLGDSHLPSELSCVSKLESSYFACQDYYHNNATIIFHYFLFIYFFPQEERKEIENYYHNKAE